MKYGWKPQLPDFRDYRYAARWFARVAPAADLRATGLMPAVYDQGQLGSCTANACAAMAEFLLGKEGFPEWTPSRLFIYYNERLIEGTVPDDAGAMVRDGLKVLNRYGFPPEAAWPYIIDRFTFDPPAAVYDAALQERVLTYSAIKRPPLGTYRFKVKPIQQALAAGFPVVFGFNVYESFESGIGADGIMPRPQRGEQLLGGHCVLIVGYKTIGGKLYFICRNSWGPDWGDGGYFYMPAQIVASRKQSSDFWTASLVSNPEGQ